MLSARFAAVAALCALSGCTTTAMRLAGSTPPALTEVTPAQRDLNALPPPPAPVPVAVYSFLDQTGQLKPSENVQTFSRAVTQGATSILIKALQDAGNGHWFTVVERERLDDLLKERQIIREMRSAYLGETQTPPAVLPSMLFAGVLLEGGVIGFDSNVQTGGIGARFLAIGANAQYRRSTVTVSMRAISVKTGEILANVMTTKSIASVEAQSNVFKFVTFDDLLEGEAGVSANEPVSVALQQAIEKAVYALIMEGASRNLWTFADPVAGRLWIDRYAGEKQRAMAAASRFVGGGALPPGAAPRRGPEVSTAADPAARNPNP